MFTETELDTVNDYLRDKVAAVPGDQLEQRFKTGLKMVFVEAFEYEDDEADEAEQDFEDLLIIEPDVSNPVFWQDCAYAIIEEHYDLLTASARADVLGRIGA